MLVGAELAVLLAFDIQAHILLCVAPYFTAGYFVLPLCPSVLPDKKPPQTVGPKMPLLYIIHYIDRDFSLIMCG